ncbi:MAG: PilZ domain-containing protein [Spirochaetes bacterium]|nr:PilZ domain-containing protein [Spirochaetota bacterium]
MTNNRKHARVSYEKQVELVAEGQTLIGKSIDISNSGIQVVVNVPVSHLSVHRMAFMLPLDSENVPIPCKIVRSNKADTEEDEHVLGIEFSCQTDAQMILIDNFIRNVNFTRIKNEYGTSDMRIIPRISCSLTGISSDKDGVSIISIDNISTEGCLVSYKGILNTRESITIGVNLPGDRRGITAEGSVSYVIRGNKGDTNRAGLCFKSISDIDSTRIQNFILKSATSTAIKTIQERRNEQVAANDTLIKNHETIVALFNLLKKEKRTMNVLFDKSIIMFVLKMRTIDTKKKLFTTSSQKEVIDCELKKHHQVYCSFYLHGSSYYFTTDIRESGPTSIAFALPSVIHQSDKRSCQRKYISGGIDISLELEDSPIGRLRGELVNISRRGFSCNVKLNNFDREQIQLGQSVTYTFNKDMGLDAFGEIRHIKEVGLYDEGMMVQIGIEAGIRRKDYIYKRFSLTQWNKGKGSLKRPFPGSSRIVSDIVRYANRDGKEIVALLNHTGAVGKVPVVILPPAFGKKKEALAPLVATLIENFGRFGRDIVTIRYDGINRPGESCRDQMCPKRGYEMLNYRISQGLDDLEATMDFVHHNAMFKPSEVVIVAFSMSALDARKLAVKDKRVSYLINVMGVTCARSSFNNITGGIDIIDNARNGIQNGLSGVLGQILNLDTTARDLIDTRYAYLADARHDMARIAIPVSWIFGKYDRWVVEREIRDLMSVRSKGSREVIEIPTGHNLRSSDDAIRTFKIVTRMIYHYLNGQTIRPMNPDRERMVAMITGERERLVAQDDVDVGVYWKEYLVGGDRNCAGYDVYRNIDEFREFLSLQGRLLDLKNGESMADMGCGTGIFIERMIDDSASQGLDLGRANLVLADLVPEALGRTREKIEQLKRTHGPLIPSRITYLQRNLEPNRLLPVKRFMEDGSLGYEFLRNRIEGLRNSTIDNLVRLNSEVIASIMRGVPISEHSRGYLRACLNDDDYCAIIDINRAARYISGTLKPDDLKTSCNKRINGSGSEELHDIRTTDLDFTCLKFGDNTRDVRMGFHDESFHKISASLLISYLFNPDEIIHEFYRLLKPEGRLLVSSMRPDSDISVIFTNYINKVQNLDRDEYDSEKRDVDLADARTMLNEAASLFQLEEDGYFRFYSGEEIAGMMRKAGFVNMEIHLSMGSPPQAVIVTGIKK